MATNAGAACPPSFLGSSLQVQAALLVLAQLPAVQLQTGRTASATGVGCMDKTWL